MHALVIPVDREAVCLEDDLPRVLEHLIDHVKIELLNTDDGSIIKEIRGQSGINNSLERQFCSL